MHFRSKHIRNPILLVSDQALRACRQFPLPFPPTVPYWISHENQNLWLQIQLLSPSRSHCHSLRNSSHKLYRMYACIPYQNKYLHIFYHHTNKERQLLRPPEARYSDHLCTHWQISFWYRSQSSRRSPEYSH